MSITLLKDKETKTKVRFSVMAANADAAEQGVAGSLYIDKDSKFSAADKIVLEISQVTA